jgi:hypothetical protein
MTIFILNKYWWIDVSDVDECQSANTQSEEQVCLRKPNPTDIWNKLENFNKGLTKEGIVVDTP